jgi:hypothetical protein
LIGNIDFDKFVFKMQVIGAAFILTMYGFCDMETELLGMPERAVYWNFCGFW